MLGHHWEKGEATVITSQAWLGYLGNTAVSRREYVVDVRPAEGASTFRAKIAQQYLQPEDASPERRLADGDLISVLCGVKRQKAKFDDKDPRRWKPGRNPHEKTSNQPSEFETAASAPPGPRFNLMPKATSDRVSAARLRLCFAAAGQAIPCTPNSV